MQKEELQFKDEIMENYISRVIQDCTESEKIYCKFLSANDSSETGGHQSGFLVSKSAYSILFDEPGVKGGDIKRRFTK